MSRAGDFKPNLGAFPSSKDPNERKFRQQMRKALEGLNRDQITEVEPAVEIQVEQFMSGGVEFGRLTVEVFDRGNNFGGFVRFAKATQGEDYDHSDPTNTGVFTVTDSAAPYTTTVQLYPKHDSVISWAVPWFYPGEADARWVTGSFAFDHNRLPELLGPLGIGFDEDGIVLANYRGDEDLDEIHFTVGLGSSPSDPTASVNDGETTTRSGTFKFDGTGTSTEKKAAVGQEVYIKALLRNTTSGLSQVVGPFRRRRMDTEYVTPKIQTTATRSGNDVQIQHTIDDPAGAFFSMEFQVDGGGWLTSWDSSTAGQSYTETVTVGAGKDTKYEYRLRHYNEDGVLVYIGDSINLADLQEVTKTIRVSHAPFVPAYESATTLGTTTMVKIANYTTPGVAMSGSGPAESFLASIPFAQGVEITQVAVRAYRGTSSTVVNAYFYRTNDSGGSATTLATLTPSGTGHSTTSSTISETVGSTSQYTMFVDLISDAAASDCRFHWVEFDYNAPSYDKTL